MGKKINIFIVLLAISMQVYSQSAKGHLLAAHSLYYKGKAYAFGYEQKNEILWFKCYAYSNSLQLQDSAELALGKHLPADYLDVNADTLHSVLNFYFQLADQKNRVTLFRLSPELKKITVAENFDANHINSLALFDQEKYMENRNLYVIRTSKDSTDKQFYLSKYTVNTMDRPFEYDFKWQYAFERQNVHRASVIYANQQVVIVYAHVDDGLKKGQWILRINAQTGELIKGTKLNAKNDNRHYLYSKALYDSVSKSIDLIGSIYPTTMFDFKQGLSNFNNLSAVHKLFLIQTDSSGAVINRIEKPLALPPPKKTGSSFTWFHLKITYFTKKKDKSYEIWADIYEQAMPGVMAYYSSWHLTLIPEEEDYLVKTAPFYVATKPLPNFISFAKGDSYGKFYLHDAGDYDRFKYAAVTNAVVLKTGLDSLQNQYFILKKTELISGKKTIFYISSGKKEAEKKLLFTFEKGQAFNLYFTDPKTYISFISNPADTEFELKLNKL